MRLPDSSAVTPAKDKVWQQRYRCCQIITNVLTPDLMLKILRNKPAIVPLTLCPKEQKMAAGPYWIGHSIISVVIVAFQLFSWNATDHRICHDIFCNDRASGNDSSLADSNTFEYDSILTYPNIVVNYNGSAYQGPHLGVDFQ